MKRPLLLLIAALAIPIATSAGELGPADLTQPQMSSAFPEVGTQWNAYCGSYDQGQNCNLKLGASQLIINGQFKVDYSRIIRSEKTDAFMAITRLAKLDPVFASWKRYRKANNIKYFNNTVLIEYLTLDGKSQTALFSFKENNVSGWYGFGNAMRMISLGAKPAQPKKLSK